MGMTRANRLLATGLLLGLCGCQSLWGGFYSDPEVRADLGPTGPRCKGIAFTATQIPLPEFQPLAIAAGALTPQSVRGGPADLVVVGRDLAANKNAVRLMRNDGTGAFTKEAIYDLSQGGSDPHVALGNITRRSGVVDVALQYDMTGSMTPLVLLQLTDDGRWTDKNFSATMANQRSINIAVADFNAEDGLGLADVVTSVNTVGFAVGYAPGGPTLNGKDYSLPGAVSAWGLAVGALNGDARPDVVIAEARQAPDDPRLTLFFNSGDQSKRFSTDQARVLSLPGMPADRSKLLVAIADLNGDGLADLAALNDTNGAASGGLVSVLLNDRAAPGTFPKKQLGLTVGKNPTALASGDLDGDGYAELVISNSGSNNLSLLRNRGGADGGFADAVDLPGLPASAGPTALAIADLNNDGNLDVVSVNTAESSLTVLLNRCP